MSIKRLALLFLALLSGLLVLAVSVGQNTAIAQGAKPLQVSEEKQLLKNPEGTLTVVEITAPAASLTQAFRLSDLVQAKHVIAGKASDVEPNSKQARELYWLKGVQLATTDKNNRVVSPLSGNLSIGVDPALRDKVFPECERCAAGQLLNLAAAQREFALPDGLGVPAASDELWTFKFQPTDPSAASQAAVTQKCTLFFIKDVELVYPIRAVSWSTPSPSHPIAFTADDKFARPEWRFKSQPGDAPFCGIKGSASQTTCQSEAATADGTSKSSGNADNTIPLFDRTKDGPLLTQPKSIELLTTAGKIHLKLDPNLAPEHVTQLCRLFSHGVYDGTQIHRYEPGFVIQVSLAEAKVDGHPPLSSAQRSLIRRLPLEVQPQVNGSVVHKKWVVSMAREDGDTSSGTSSFSVLLGNAPHLDKQYTIFGAVIPDATSVATLQRMMDEWPIHHPSILKTREM